ncbi:MAG TPA: hypothetical protein VE753_04545 [Gaiellaceae bacterium]|jgi:hypothetical protein|nr:hypothetical protein [Gaiellaceae bacterium]
MKRIGLAAARFLGKSRKIALFAGLVAAAGLVNELRRRRQRSAAI